MLSIKSPQIVSQYLEYERKKGKRIGFIPTMGAIHQGHVSLIERSTLENDVTICSIFVNPKQFNEQKDLDHYPRPLSKDMEILILAGVDILFLPDVDGVYPTDFDDSDIDLKGLDHYLEGEHRPGHFQGVAKVVRRFFDVIQPDKAYFGQKDFQQTAVVRMLIDKFHPSTELIVCPIIREENGLAFSSRNERLTAGERSNAAFIYQSLKQLKEDLSKMDLQKALDKTRLFIESYEGATIDYLEAVDGYNMEKVESMSSSEFIVVVTVVNYGGVRLLDNLYLKEPENELLQ